MKHSEVKTGRLPIFKERLRRLQGEMSNTEFAEFLGMTRQTVGFYLNGDRIPDALTLCQIAEKCHVSADWLLGLSQFQSLNGELSQVCEYTGLPENVISQINYECQSNDICSFALQFIFHFCTGKDFELLNKYAIRSILLKLSYHKSVDRYCDALDKKLEKYSELTESERSEVDSWFELRSSMEKNETALDERLWEEVMGTRRPGGHIQVSPSIAADIYKNYITSYIDSCLRSVMFDIEKAIEDELDKRTTLN